MHTPPLADLNDAPAPLGGAPFASKPLGLDACEDSRDCSDVIASLRARVVTPVALDPPTRVAPPVRRTAPPTLVAELREIAARQPEPGWDSFRSRVGADQYRALHEVLARRIAPDARVLDWGVGVGHLSYALVRLGCRAVGFAVGPSGSSGWIEGPRYTLVRGEPADLARLPFDDAAFDVVVSAGLLEKVRALGGDEGASMREVRRILRPGGLFICGQLPNQTHRTARTARGRSSQRRRFSEWDLRRLLHDADMTLLEWARYGFLPREHWARLPAWVRSSEPIANAWNLADGIGSTLGKKRCLHHLFVARRPSV